MAATKEATRKDLEICLARLEFPERKALLETTHVLSANLLWPRVGIAKRNAQQEIRLRHGLYDGSAAPWHERILFKEEAEGDFALSLSLTVSVTRTWLRNFRRTMAGYALKSVGESVDDIGPAGEAAEVPMKALSKNLLESKEPELLAQGAVDLNAAQFGETPVEIRLPLYSALEIMKLHRRYAAVPVAGTAIVAIRTL